MRFVQSPYFSSRNNYNIDLVVIHTTVGFYEGTIKYFQSNDRKVSAHYVVKEDGNEICQMVDETYAAHHAGIVSNPNPKYYKGININPNWYSVGIENSDNNQPASHDRTGQYKALAILVRDICKRWNIPIDRNHICGHRELYDKKTCPGNIDVDKVVKLAQEADFTMDDDTKRALEQLQLAKKEFGFGNLESAVRGLVGTQHDIVAVKAELQSYKDGEEFRIKSAVDSAITENNKSWQSQIDTANENIQKLTKEVEYLKTGQAENLSYSTLFSIAWKKFWIFRKSS
jgi:N-acetylmuramoyl-L-alanine amidase CwlA